MIWIIQIHNLTEISLKSSKCSIVIRFGLSKNQKNINLIAKLRFYLKQKTNKQKKKKKKNEEV